MIVKISRDGRNVIIKTKDFKGGQIFRFLWNEVLGGLMIAFAVFVSPYCIVGALLGLFIKFKKINKGHRQIKRGETA